MLETRANQVDIPDPLGAPKLTFWKYALVLAGQYIPGRGALHLRAATNYLTLGHWVRSHGFRVEKRVRDRAALFAHIAKLIGDRQTLFLEFGVYRGASMLSWSRLLRNPDCVFHGFDSFLGMPEDFDERTGVLRGALDEGGEIPNIIDPRVSFIKGWFEDTLPKYEPPPHDQPLIHIDCDLHSACSVPQFVRHLGV
jgi:hypothetical protein